MSARRGFGDHACRGNRESQTGSNSHSARSGACRPAVAIGNRACKSATAIAPETASAAGTRVVADALPQPRWAYAHRSCRERSPTGAMATFTMHKRIHTKSGGRQPAVAIENRACKSATAITRKTASAARTCVVADALPQPRWAYADRSRSRPNPPSRGIRKFPCTRVPRRTVGLRPPLFGPAARVCTP